MAERNTSGVVIGMDGGGTHTRVMVADCEGNVLAYVEKGASSIRKDLQAMQNVREALEEALLQAGRDISEVMALTAGMAGLDSESDLEWVLPMTALDGLDCPKQHVNDAVVAHSGALLSEPGIIVISGTGSIIFAMNENGRAIRNYDAHHYAASAARFLSYDATFELLAGNVDDSDQDLVDEMLRFWEAPSVEELTQLALQGFVADRRERNRKFAQLAPAITEAAMGGSRLARTVCDRAVHQIVVGVEIVASRFSGSEVAVALIGSVVNSDYFQRQLTSALKTGNNKRYRLVPPVFSPVAGAVLMALKQLGLTPGQAVLQRLGQHPRSRHD
ncbi:BadF/BadG/BcrA/BcrD ATPase family protein [Paenibacillus flagellatus]|uniref:ATPase n=1 Tax=Paenibacillus flagellatus TaxID=2211139 RepID=A0A2V5KPB0_9BACL|nr:BadF/BadG/BcrA/BcrD ATPase family protein [Paenibacillus flagellatus]PYI57280.1 ATPase [Paenibacillus flagellatus]